MTENIIIRKKQIFKQDIFSSSLKQLCTKLKNSAKNSCCETVASVAQSNFPSVL